MISIAKADGHFTISMTAQEHHIFEAMMDTLVGQTEVVDWAIAADDDVTLESVDRLLDSWIARSFEQAPDR